MISQKITLLFVLLTVLICNCTILLAKPIPIKKAIQLIKSKEKVITSISWECKTNKYQSDNNGKLTLINEPPLPSYANVFIDSQRHFRIEKSIHLPVMKDVPDTEYNSLITYDGKTYRMEVSHVTPNKPLRFDGYLFQESKKNISDVNWNLYPEGIGYVFPYFSWSHGALMGNVKYLSEYLEYILSLKRTIKVEEDEDGVWLITSPDYIDPQDGTTVYVQFQYDPGKGKSGAVLSIRVFDSGVLEDKNAGAKTTFFLQDIEGFFVPKTIKVEQLMGAKQPSRYTILEYDNFKVNIPLVKDDFFIHWKTGTTVIDFITGKNYLVSDSPIDEVQAVQHFMSLEGLSKPLDIQNRSVLFFRTILVVLGFALITYGLYLRFKKEK